MSGPAFDKLALGIGIAVQTWGVGNQSNLGLIGATTGTVGAGIINPVTTKLVVPPAMPVVLLALIGAGMVGPLTQPLAAIVALGISQSFTISAQYAGPSAGVGLGADVSKITTSNGSTLITALMNALTATSGSGSGLSIMATGLGNGIANLLMLGAGIGSVNGPPAPAPGAGTSKSMVV